MLRIADFSRVLAGPYATMLLADFGAEVVKIEPPGGDETRHWVPPQNEAGISTYFAAVNRNKQSVVLDLNTDAGRARALEIVMESDVLVENFAPGTMAKFGLDYERVHALRPELIYCSLTGFGPDAGSLPGYDLVIQAVGGLMSVTGPDAQHPSKVGVAVVDIITGLHAALGIQQALLTRNETGRGQHVEVNLLSSLLSALSNQSSSWLGAGSLPKNLGNAHPSIAPYSLFAAQDRPLAVAVGNDAQFVKFAGAVGRPEWAKDERFSTNAARVANRSVLTALIEEVFSARPAAEWVEMLQAVRVPSGAVNDIAQAFDLAQSLGLHPVVEVDGQKLVANPISLSETPATYRLPPPQLPPTTH